MKRRREQALQRAVFEQSAEFAASPASLPSMSPTAVLAARWPSFSRPAPMPRGATGGGGRGGGLNLVDLWQRKLTRVGRDLMIALVLMHPLAPILDRESQTGGI